MTQHLQPTSGNKVYIKILIRDVREPIIYESPESDARAFMDKFFTGELPPMVRGYSFLVGKPWGWVVRSADIAAIHTFHVVTEDQTNPYRGMGGTWSSGN